MDNRHDILFWQRRVRELEEKVEQLRLSRRVLMNLVEKLERDKSNFLSKLERENKKLHSANYRYARWLFKKNHQIVELESKLKPSDPQDSAN